MKIGGIVKLTLIDYPGKLACIIFTQGCPFRCSFCHNPSLVIPSLFIPSMDEKEIFKFLEERKGKLEGVVISGGEPTIQEDLESFIQKVKDLGYLVKLDTSGIDPEKLQHLINKNLLDYITMDIKAPLNKYEKIINRKIDIEKIKQSIEIIKKFKSYEFRTTVIKEVHTKEDIIDMAQTIKNAKKYVLQTFIPNTTLKESFKNKNPISFSFLKEEIEKYIEKLELR